MATRPRDGTKYLEYFKSINQFRELIRKLPKEFEGNLANQTKKNNKNFWRYKYKSKTTIKQGIGELNTDYTNTKSKTTTTDEEKGTIFAYTSLVSLLQNSQDVFPICPQ